MEYILRKDYMDKVGLFMYKNNIKVFVGQRRVGKNTLLLQVAFTIPDDRVKEREFGNLLQLNDNYRKMVISLDEIQLESYQGIEHWHLRKFLTEFK